MLQEKDLTTRSLEHFVRNRLREIERLRAGPDGAAMSETGGQLVGDHKRGSGIGFNDTQFLFSYIAQSERALGRDAPQEAFGRATHEHFGGAAHREKITKKANHIVNIRGFLHFTVLCD